MDPFKEFTHGGTLSVAEILFNTRFDYMFPLLAANPECLLPPGAVTQGALLALGTAMASDTLALALDSQIPAVFTYLGQFIDHNITAQTDREIGVSRIATPDGNVMDITPIPSKEVVKKLVNGRRPKLDLNQVYGDGPRLGTNASPTEADELFDPATLNFKVVADAPGFDVPRQDDGTAIIADMRNNENLNISQLHCAFLLFHNKVAAGLPAALTKDQRYIRARQLVRWAYQYIVLNDYLTTVCDPTVVSDIAANGVRFYAPDNDLLFLPLEFSVAAFRFGHSMIRPQYVLNSGTTVTLAQALSVKGLLAGGPPPKIAGADIIEWHNFAVIPAHPAPQKARKIDPRISAGLGTLPVFLQGSMIPVGPLLQHLARRNLLRGFLLSIPTGQAMADGMQTKPLTPAELQGPAGDIQNAVIGGNFDTATPLWYYILREAEVQQGGNRLGSVGSRIVAETLTALVRRDGASYLNNLQDPAVKPNGIDVGGTIISTIAGLLEFSGAPL
ncbi:MAG TPA: heme peroxidase family protein [Acidobacteriaceae bacterium]|nr:heme peroxidase family protein [Acidobacteriaceae bacterium]